MSDQTFAIGLTLALERLTLSTPTTGLALTRDGTLALCGGDTAVAVQLSPEELAWFGRAAQEIAAERERDAASPANLPAYGHVAGHA